MNKEVVQTTPVLERDKITEKNLKTLRIENSGSGEPGTYWTNNIEMGNQPLL
jgi:hypothetical protein